ncbi:YdhR family protein [Nocardia otitidiscaviarum]|uniref:hypothetical protein n=1 Tax=Nocardia otitidiscaviarum TaxID=1823 RepID=UPI00163DD31B|nr:hypothetical protein [Nocardia otitidiscaviarum]MCP9624546.1 YdhR family protein [Nocardia otitidiscaviarum]
MHSSVQARLSVGRTVRAMARCLIRTLELLARRRIHLPAVNRGARIDFADGTAAHVFRETVIDRAAAQDPCVLAVEFQLRAVHGAGHALFRRESLLNTLLFAGFPGLITKLWLAHDQRGRYRGLYEWDDPAAAESYARTLWGVLALVCVPGSIAYRVLPGLRRADLLEPADSSGAGDTIEDDRWWLPVRSSRPIVATAPVGIAS